MKSGYKKAKNFRKETQLYMENIFTTYAFMRARSQFVSGSSELSLSQCVLWPNLANIY